MAGVIEAVRNLWLAVTGRKQPAAPEVILFDGAAPVVHDLDDPFFDETIQMRVAEKIAATGNRKTKNSY